MDATEYIKMANKAYESGREKVYIPVLMRGLRHWPNSPILWKSLGDAHRRLQSPFTEVQDSFSQFVRAEIGTKSDFAEEAWGSFGRLMEDNGRYDSAEQSYRQAIRINPIYKSATGRLSFVLSRHKGAYLEAEALARRCVELDKSDAWSWFNLAYIVDACLNRPLEAICLYKQCIEIDPLFVVAWENLAVLMAFESDHWDSAEAVFIKAFGLRLDNPRVWTAFGYYLYYATDRYTESEEAFQNAIKIDNEDWGACLGLGQLYQNALHRPDLARRLFSDAKQYGAPEHDVLFQRALLSNSVRSFRIVN